MLPYLRFILRRLRRHPAYVALHVAGLGLAVACCLLLYWFGRFHRSFEAGQPALARICRLVTEGHYGGTSYSEGIPTPVGPALRRAAPWLPAVAMSIGQQDQYVRVLGAGGQPEAKYAEAQAVAFVEPQYFEVLRYGWRVGTARQALRYPFTAVLTRRLARKYFGREDAALGRCLRLNNHLDVQVTGLLDDLPSNTDQPYELFISYETLRYSPHEGTPLTAWEGVSSQTHGWVLLPPGGTPAQLQRALTALHRAESPATLAGQHYRVLPLADLHYSPAYNPERYVGRRTLQVLALLAGLLLLTAGINFVNLATAQALGRQRELGVRRAIGATRRQVLAQALAETLLLVLAAEGAGLVLARALLPALRAWTATPLPEPLDGPTGGLLAALAGALTLGAGWYPGRVLASYGPLGPGLKGRGRATPGAGGRRALVVAQLALSQGFVLAVVVMLHQLTVWLHADPGFAAGGRVLLPARWLNPPTLARFTQELRRVPGVQAISFCYDAPAIGTTNTDYFFYDHRPQREPFMLARLPADAQYLRLFGLPLVAGRSLPDSAAPAGFLLNEQAVRQLGIGRPAAVLGHHLRLLVGGDTLAGVVRGVVRDWRYAGFQQGVLPTVLYTSRDEYVMLAVQLTAGRGDSLPPAVRALWQRYYPQQLFGVRRVAATVAGFYAREQQQLALVRLAAGTALVIGSLGLYGLVAFLAERRRREIGIRRVLGARPGQLAAGLLGEFAGLLAVAFVVAAPLTGWLLHRWLGQFATHVGLAPWQFAVALGSTALLTLLTIGYQTWRAVTAPPAPALRAP